MPSLTLKLDRRDRDLIVQEVREVLVMELRSFADELKSHNDNRLPEGVRVLSAAQVAEEVGKSERHLLRLEAEGKMPRRRRISRRRTGYLAHEIDGLPPEAVAIRDGRKISRKSLAEKLGLAERTLVRLIKAGKAPPAADGEWYERDVDAWLLSRPTV